jgi:Protein of unknown function (DUF2924)
MAAREKPIGPGERMSRPAPASRWADSLDALVAGLADLDVDKLRLQWRNHLGGIPPVHLPRWLLARVLAQRIQIATLGGLDRATLQAIRQSKGGGEDSDGRPFAPRNPATKEGVGLKAGALLVREWNGEPQRVMVLEKGFAWNGKTYGSLSQIAKAMTGTSWNGHRFFGLRPASRSFSAKTEGARSVGRAKGRLQAFRGPASRTDVSDELRVGGAVQGITRGRRNSQLPDRRPCPTDLGRDWRRNTF